MPRTEYDSMTLPKRDTKELDAVAEEEKCMTRPETIRRLMEIRREHKRLLRVMELMGGGRRTAESENVGTETSALQAHFMGLMSPV